MIVSKLINYPYQLISTKDFFLSHYIYYMLQISGLLSGLLSGSLNTLRTFKSEPNYETGAWLVFVKRQQWGWKCGHQDKSGINALYDITCWPACSSTHFPESGSSMTVKKTVVQSILQDLKSLETDVMDTIHFQCIKIKCGAAWRKLLT